jgi:ATP-binding cassette, subfamily C (CFTR/MRP), member 2
LIALILEHIETPKEEDKGIAYGLGLVAAYVTVDVIQSIVWQRAAFLQDLLGIRANHGLVSLIYEKILRLSSATNKEFSQGEIINFIDVDVEQINHLAYIFPLVARLPIQLLFSLSFLFYYFGVTLFTAVGVGLAFSLVNFICAKLRANLQEKILKVKDKRMRHTTELVNNIKVVKLNSWKDFFITKIMGFRSKEVFLIKIDIWIDAFMVAVAWIITPSLTLATFLVFFLAGHDISVAKAYATYQVFTYLEMPLRWVPEFISSYMQFKVSMKRIQKFLL